MATRRTTVGPDVSNGSRWQLLRDYLLRFYRPDQPVTLLSSGTGVSDKPSRTALQLADLERATDQMSQGWTLFIPGQLPKSINREVYSLLIRSAQTSS